jgi:hypothetical protein
MSRSDRLTVRAVQLSNLLRILRIRRGLSLLYSVDSLKSWTVDARKPKAADAATIRSGRMRPSEDPLGVAWGLYGGSGSMGVLTRAGSRQALHGPPLSLIAATLISASLPRQDHLQPTT